MSTRGIYTAVSGAMARSAELDSIANNIANASTAGFKKDNQVFSEYMTAYEKQPSVIEVPKVPSSIDSFYPINGGDKSYVDIAGTSTSFSQGAIKQTGSPLDLAIQGDGFFEVLTPGGFRWTRNGQWTINSKGQLSTKQGFPILMEGEQGEPLDNRKIPLEDKTKLNITPGGQIFVDGKKIGQLSVMTNRQKDSLQKVGGSLYTVRENFQSPMEKALHFRVHQGGFEQSNVNIVQEMTRMIQSTRLFESAQKVIQSYDDMNSKLVNEVGKLP